MSRLADALAEKLAAWNRRPPADFRANAAALKKDLGGLDARLADLKAKAGRGRRRDHRTGPAVPA